MRFLYLLFCLLSYLCLGSLTAAQENRLALLIGNQDYQLNELDLRNPYNDISRMASALRFLGFKVKVIKDADLAVLHRATRRYASRLKEAGANTIGFFYYSGHGAMDQSTKRNYIIPTDVRNVSTKRLWADSVELSFITRELKETAPEAVHIVVFDACRNELRLKKAGTRSLVQPKGFLPEKMVSRMLIAYSTAAGQTATDEGEGAGHFAQALSVEIVKPGREIIQMFRRVQLRVSKQVGQEPWLSYNALPEYYLAGKVNRAGRFDAALEYWNSIRNSKSVNDYQEYIRQFPNGRYVEIAKLRIRKLQVSTQRNKGVHSGKRNEKLDCLILNSKVSKPIRISEGQRLCSGESQDYSLVTRISKGAVFFSTNGSVEKGCEVSERVCGILWKKQLLFRVQVKFISNDTLIAEILPPLI